MLVYLSVGEQNYTESLQTIWMKPCRIMDYCYGKNRLNFGLDSAQNGRMVAILNFRYRSLYKIIIYRAYMCTVCFSSTFAAASPLLALAEIRGLLTCHPCVLIFINEMCMCILCMLYCQCIVNQLVVRLYTRWRRLVRHFGVIRRQYYRMYIFL